MKITDVKKENNKVILTIQPDSKNWVDELSKTRKRLAKNIAIPGFRKGHAPQKVIDQSITINQVISSTLDKFVNEIVNKFIKEESHKYEDIIRYDICRNIWDAGNPDGNGDLALQRGY